MHVCMKIQIHNQICDKGQNCKKPIHWVNAKKSIEEKIFIAIFFDLILFVPNKRHIKS